MPVTEERGSVAARLGIACALLRAGQVIVALHQLTELADEARSGGLDDVERATLLAALVDCRLARGELAEADALGDSLAPLARLDGVAGAIATFSTAELAAVLGDPEHAISLFLSAGERAAGRDVPPDVAPWRAGAVLTMVRIGRRDVRELAIAHYEEAVSSGSPYAVSLALRTLATANADGRRLALLREARAALHGVVAGRLAAQIDTDIAGLLMLSHDPGDEAEAVRLLRGAELYAGRQELLPLRSRIDRLLDRLGKKPRPVQSEAVATLTQAERRVAELAAGGLTNRLIAERLEVSVKAVEWHLSRIYRKLGIRSRHGLTPTVGAAV
jgi:ATP/maltotriose-dependent transcriptional regulator MalT